MDDCVRYGDVLLLRCKELSGVLGSFGFLETQVFLQEGDANAPNGRGMRFRILPKQSYEVRADYQRALLQPDKLPALRTKLALEEDLNRRIVQQSAGKAVCYGHEVQFEHEMSGMSLAGSGETAEVDRACYSLKLLKSSGEGVHFRIHAHLHLRKSGDPVSYHDPVLLYCAALNLHLHITPNVLPREASTALYTHLSANVASSTVDFAERYEANLSVEQTVLQFEPFGKRTEGNWLIGGDVVRLQHTELQGEVCCQGYDYTKNGLADVFVRKDKSEHPFEQTSAYGLFIVEHCGGRGGRICAWREEGEPTSFRLRHLTTRRLVSAAGDTLSLAKHPHEMGSNESELVQSTQLFPTAIEETSYISDCAVVQLTTGEAYWRVSGEEWTDPPLQGPESRDMDSAAFSSFEIDELATTQAKVQIAASRDKKDAFRLIRAEVEETQEIEFVMSALAPLQRAQMAFKQDGDVERNVLEKVERTLVQMILFCMEAEEQNAFTCEGPTHPRRQKFLRELGVLDLVCCLMRLPFLSSHYNLPLLQPGDLITNICTLCYRLTRLAAQDNRANELYCAQWMGLFLWHVQGTWQSEVLRPELTVTEILSDNWQLLAHHLSKDLVAQFLQLMVLSRNPLYVALVSTLCTCQGRPVPRNQNIICDLMRTDESLSNALLISLRQAKESVEINVFDMWISLELLPQVSAEKDKGSTNAYFVAVMDLLVNLAQGRNHQTKQFRANFPLEICFACAFNPSLSDIVRSKFLRLALFLHLDQSDTRPLQLPRLSRTRAPAPLARLTQHIYEAKAFVRDCLQLFSPQQRADELDRNSLVLEVLRLARFLVNCGLYSASELKALEPLLVDFLDGTNDIQERDTSRYTQSHSVVLRCKETICDLLLTICNIELDGSLTLLLAERQESEISIAAFPQRYSKHSRRPSSAITLLERQNGISLSSLEQAVSDQLVPVDSRLSAVLLDLTQYSDRTLASSSFRLLQRLHSRRTELVRQLRQVQLLDSPDLLAVYESILPQVSRLNVAAEEAELWMGRSGDSSTHTQVVEILQRLLELLSSQKRLPELDLSVESEVKLARALSSVRPDPIMQRMLRNLRIQEPILELLANRGIVVEFNPERYREVLRCCYLLLARFCQDNAENQTLLFPYMERVLEDVSSDLCAGILVQESFRGNFTLCSQIRPRFLRGFVAQVQAMPQGPSKAWLVSILSVLTEKAPGVQLETASLLCSKLDISRSWLEKCASMKVTSEVPLEISFLMCVLDVLTSCAEDQHFRVQQICRQAVPLDLALLLLSSQYFWPLRRAVLRFTQRIHLEHEFSHDKLPEEAVKRLMDLAGNDFETIKNLQGKETTSWESGGVQLKEADAALIYAYEALIPALTTLLRRRGASVVLLSKPALSQNIASFASHFHSMGTNDQHMQVTSSLLRTLQGLASLRSMLSEITIQPTTRRLAHQLAAAIRRNDEETEEEVKPRLDEEFLSFVRCLREVERVTSQGLPPGWQIKLKELFAGLIDMARKEMAVNNAATAVVVIKVLRKHIELMNAEKTNPAAEWSSADWEKCRTQVTLSQDLLRELGALTLAADLYKTSKSEEIRNECALFLIAALLGGNNASQAAFLTYFQHDHSNTFLKEVMAQLSAYFTALQVMVAKAVPGESILDETEEVAVEMDPAAGACRLLRLLQLLCEGHNLSLQEYLREQTQEDGSNAFSLNIVVTLGSLLNSFSRMPHRLTMEVGQQLLDTLTEVVQGPCPTAQTDLSQPNILDSCKDLLSGFRTPQERALRQLEKSSISELKGKAATFLLALLEGENKEIAKRVTSFLDFPKVLSRLTEVFQDFVKELGLQADSASISAIDALLHSDSFDGEINEGFSLYILLEKLAEFNSAARSQLPNENFPQQVRLAYSFFAHHTGRIEVVQNRVLQRVYFPINPICRLIPESRRRLLLRKVSRETPTSKAQGLVTVAGQLMEELELAKRSRLPLTCTLELYEICSSVCFVLSLWINFIILFWLDFTVDDNSYMNSSSEVVVEVLGIILLIICLVTLLLWACAEGVIVVNARWQARALANANTNPEPPLVDANYVSLLSPSDTMRILLARGPAATEFTVSGSRDFRHFSTTLLYRIISAWYQVSAPGFQLLAVQCVLAGLGLKDTFLFSLLPFSMVFRNQTLSSIVLAISGNARQLIMTLALACAVMFIYALWGFSLEPWRYWQSGFNTQGWGETLCQNLWQCWLTTLDNGLRLSGGIGDLLVKASFDDKEQWYSRFFLDSSYFFVVRLVFLSITAGIIIDSFAAMRETKKQRSLDKRTKCFICSCDRAVIDRVGGGFERHCEKDHNVWHYLCFAVHLRRKDPMEYTGAEALCAEQLASNEIGWLPVLRAMCLPDQPAEQLCEQLDRVSAQAQGLLTAVSKL